MLDISLVSNQSAAKPAEDIFEGENRIYDIVVNGFGTLDTSNYNLWVIYELPSGAVMVSDKVSIGAGNDDKIVSMRDGVLMGEGVLKIQAVISTADNIFNLAEQYASGDCEYPIYKSKVYEFYISDSIDIVEEIMPSGSGISQDAKDYLGYVINQIIAEGFQIDDELDSSSINAVQNKVVNEALNGKVNISDISDSVSRDASSTTKVPSVKAIKDYTDKALLRKANLKILPFYQENGELIQMSVQAPYLVDTDGLLILTYYISQPGSVSNDFLTASAENRLTRFRINDSIINFNVDENESFYYFMANCETDWVLIGGVSQFAFRQISDGYPIYLMTVNKNTGTVGLFSSISGNISWAVEGYGGTVLMEEDVSNSITTDASSTTKVPSVKAIKDYVDAANLEQSTLLGVAVDLKIANARSNDVDTDADSTTKMPSVKAVVDYVDEAGELYVAKRTSIDYEKQNTIIQDTTDTEGTLNDSTGTSITAYKCTYSNPSPPSELISAAGNGQHIDLIIDDEKYVLTPYSQRRLPGPGTIQGYWYVCSNAERMGENYPRWNKVDDSDEIIVLYIDVLEDTVSIISSKSYNLVSWRIVRELMYVSEDELQAAISDEFNNVVSNDVSTDASSTTKVPSVKAFKDYADALVISSSIAVSNDISGDAASLSKVPSVKAIKDYADTGLSGKIDRTDIITGSVIDYASSTTKTPCVKSIKTYVDDAIASAIGAAIGGSY